jgi:hypothetical protein
VKTKKILLINFSICLVLIFVSSYHLYQSRYNNPIYFYKNFSLYSEREGKISILHNLYQRITTKEYKMLLEWMLTQLNNRTTIEIAIDEINNKNYFELNECINYYQKFIDSIPCNTNFFEQ